MLYKLRCQKALSRDALFVMLVMLQLNIKQGSFALDPPFYGHQSDSCDDLYSVVMQLSPS